jgi:hypothetical protein
VVEDSGVFVSCVETLSAAAAAAAVLCLWLLQRLRSFQPDAVMAVGLPASVLADNLACVLSHALGGVPFIDINGNALMNMPASIPQVWFTCCLNA